MINLPDLEALAARADEPTADGLNARDLLVSLMPEVVAELRDTRAAVPPKDVEAFLKAHRDQEEPRTARWAALDDVLDDYRLHAHLGAPLSGTVHERDCDEACACGTGTPAGAMYMVAEFHAAFGLPMRTTPDASTAAVDHELATLRADLHDEETDELYRAFGDRNVVAIADALADIVYVAYGTALTYGIDLDAVLAEVHRANMSKLGPDGRPLLREDGKVFKSQRYRPPDVGRVLADQGALPIGKSVDRA